MKNDAEKIARQVAVESRSLPPPVWKRLSKQEFYDILVRNNGIVTACCRTIDCTYRQFYNAIDHYGLRNELAELKKNLVSTAETAVLDILNGKSESLRLEAAKLVLRSRMAQEFGWGSDPQVQIAQQINIADKEQKVREIFGI